MLKASAVASGVMAEAPVSSDPAIAQWLGHPRALFPLCLTECLERFAFYGVQSVLLFYLTDRVLNHQSSPWSGVPAVKQTLGVLLGSTDPSALGSEVFGIYSSLIYLGVIFGGVLGDKLMGARRAVMLGAVALLCGYVFLLTRDGALLGLLLLVGGCGLLKGNITTQVSALYGPGDPRRPQAFSIFYMAIATGAGLGPLVCGGLGSVLGYHFAFALAAVSMVAALGLYAWRGPSNSAIAAASHEGVAAAPERSSMAHLPDLLAVLGLISVYWIGSGEVSNVFNLWLRDRVDRHVAGVEIPPPTFQSLDTLASVAFTPLLVIFWRRQAGRGREPDEIGKIVRGALISASAYGLLVLAAVTSPSTGPSISPIWAVAFLILNVVGYLHVWPVGLSLFARLAPPSLQASTIGLYYLAPFIGMNLVGYVGSFYARLPGVQFWLIHLLCVAAVAPLAWALRWSKSQESIIGRT